MELAELQLHWNAHGEIDPLWAILSQADKRGNAWDEAEFFAAGVRQVEELFQRLDRLRIDRPSGPALDFGCGVGRLTQALLRHVERCVGVDIAASMIQRAEACNRHGDRARYVVNTREDLSLFAADTFEFVYSSIVLQHMEPRYALGYIREFIRVLRPGGLCVFQLPAGLRSAEEIAARFPEHVAFAPLPDEGCRAWIAVDPPPQPLAAGRRFTLPVRVRNTSSVRWPQFGQPDTKYAIRLGNRWYDERGEHVEQFDERLFFDRSLEPGDESCVNLAINAPHQPGRYLLEIDVAQEWVGWFRERGNRAACVGVEVVMPGNDGDPASEQATFDPRIEMFAVSRDEVAATVKAAGGRVLHIEDLCGRPTDLDYEYFITKP
jgi:SAM-dependent methyltransferase